MMVEDLQHLASNSALFFKEIRGQNVSAEHRDILAKMIIKLQKRNQTYEDIWESNQFVAIAPTLNSRWE